MRELHTFLLPSYAGSGETVLAGECGERKPESVAGESGGVETLRVHRPRIENGCSRRRRGRRDPPVAR